MKAKEERDAQKAKAKSKGKRAKSCGFCGGTGHNRRDCSEMTTLNNRLIRANNHWRQRLYKTFVEEMGIGAGALIKVTEQTGSWNNRTTEEHVAIITSVNWNELNMFCHVDRNNRNWNTRIHDNLESPLNIKVQVNGRERMLSFPERNGQSYAVIDDVHGRPLIDTLGYNYNSVTFKSTMSPTETPLSEDWLTQGQAECVEFITKRYSQEKLKEWKAIQHLEKYEKRYNLTQQS